MAEVEKKLGMSLDDLINASSKSSGAVRKAKGGDRGGNKRATPYQAPAGGKGNRSRGNGPPKSSHSDGNKANYEPYQKSSNSAAPYNKQWSGSNQKGSWDKSDWKAPSDNGRRIIKVTNVPFTLSWKELKDAFSEVGPVERCDIDQGIAIVVFHGEY